MNKVTEQHACFYRPLVFTLTTCVSVFLFLTYITYGFQDTSIVNEHLKLYYVFFAGAAFLASIKLAYQPELSIKPVFIFYLPFIALLLWCVLSLLWSLAFDVSIFHCLKYFIYMVFAVTVTCVYAKRPFHLFSAVLTGLAISVIILSVQYIFTFITNGGLTLLANPMSPNFASKIAEIDSGFGGGKNLLASWFCFNLTFTVPMLKSISRQHLANIVAFFGAPPLVLTFSRTSIGALFIFLIVSFIWLKWKDFKRITPFPPRLILLLLPALLLFCPAGILTKEAQHATRPIEHLKGKTSDPGLTGRLYLWETAITSIKEKPVLGTGIGTIHPAYYYGKGAYHNDNYHNVYLQFFAQTGLVGLILFGLWSARLFSAPAGFSVFRSGQVNSGHLWGKILVLNLIAYYAKAFLMFQYFDLEIWTLIIFSGILYVHKSTRCAQRRPCGVNTTL